MQITISLRKVYIFIFAAKNISTNLVKSQILTGIFFVVYFCIYLRFVWRQLRICAFRCDNFGCRTFYFVGELKWRKKK